MSEFVHWEELEQMDFKALSDISKWCNLGAGLAKDTGLILALSKSELEDYMKNISLDPRSTQSRARRVSNHLAKIINHMAGAKKEFELIPATILKQYEMEILAARQKNRPKIDLTK